VDALQQAKLNVVKKHWIQVGEERERERITKTLQKYEENNYIHQEIFDEVISIIKGETNG
jgi:hypothetical protein